MSLENTVRTLGYRITDLKRRLETRISTDETNLADHLADTTDAHDASAVSIVDSGAYYTGTQVEAALQEVGSSLASAVVVEQGLYTPTLGNMVVGTGGSLNEATYTYVGGPSTGDRGIIDVSGGIIFGTSGTTFPAGGTETIRLPSGFQFDVTNSSLVQVGRTTMQVAGANYDGLLWRNGTVDARLVYKNTSGTQVIIDITATVPATWAAGHIIRWHINAAVIRA